MQQKRLILALLISTAILFSWSYLVPVKTPPQNPVENLSAPSPTPTPASLNGSPAPVPPEFPTTAAVAESPQVSRRNLSIKTPLYEAKFDSLGSEVVSWIIKKNKDSGHQIYSVASDKNNKVPLELVPAEGLKRQPREAPLQIITGDSVLDALLTTRNYQIEGVDTPNGDLEIVLGAKEKRSITFSFGTAQPAGT